MRRRNAHHRSARQPRSDGDFHGMVGQSEAMRRTFERIERFARVDVPVLILGETGTGKEMVARAIARIRDDQPFIAVNCAAIPENLLESELFGHERGAFTGATRRHVGVITRANGGLLFLDEIGDLALHAQAKLLRVMETGEYRAVGGEKVLRSDFRVIAATNRAIDALAEKDDFRRDLLHRLGVARIHLPPLRERVDDVPILARSFLDRYRSTAGVDAPVRLTRAALRLLEREPWPGNVRELRNMVEAASALAAHEPAIDAHHVVEIISERDSTTTATRRLPTLAEALSRTEQRLIGRALQRAAGDVESAAELLGVSRSTLYRKLASHNGASG